MLPGRVSADPGTIFCESIVESGKPSCLLSVVRGKAKKRDTTAPPPIFSYFISHTSKHYSGKKKMFCISSFRAAKVVMVLN